MEEQDLIPYDQVVTDRVSTEGMPEGPQIEVIKTVGEVAEDVMGKYRKAQDSKFELETRGRLNFKRYRGDPDEETAFTTTEKSKVTIKVTKTKVLAASQQINDVLLSTSKFPIVVEPKYIPEGIEDAVHIEMDPNLQQLKPGENWQEFRKRVGPYEKLLEGVPGLSKGPGKTPSQPTLEPAKQAAYKMNKKIQDQLSTTRAKKQLRSVSLECALYGTGILKGPFTEIKEIPKWEGGQYTPEFKKAPKISHVSFWDFFPDPDANSMDEVEWVIQRHKMSRSKLRAKKKDESFFADKIDAAIEYGENYIRQDYEQELEDATKTTSSIDRFEVLEYWGNMDTEILRDYKARIPAKYSDQEELAVNIWVCNGEVIRFVVNPFTPAKIPYHVVPYEINPYSIFGFGVADNMRDPDMLMNGFLRMAVDNAALSGNVILEIDKTNLEETNMEVWPGKIFVREGGQPGTAINSIQIPNVANQNLQLFDKARVLADEFTGLPSFAHGQTGVTGIGRTASGISMLMDAAHGSIKGVIKNFDDFLLEPLGQALVAYNMKFDPDEEIKGDLEVKAIGTSALLANEMRSQRLMQFLGVVQNPMLAPFARLDYIVKEIAIALDLDPEKVSNNMAEAAIQASKLQAMMGQMQPSQGPQAPGSPMDANIAPPGSDQFTGTPQEQGPPAPEGPPPA